MNFQIDLIETEIRHTQEKLLSLQKTKQQFINHEDTELQIIVNYGQLDLAIVNLLKSKGPMTALRMIDFLVLGNDFDFEVLLHFLKNKKKYLQHPETKEWFVLDEYYGKALSEVTIQIWDNLIYNSKK